MFSKDFAVYKNLALHFKITYYKDVECNAARLVKVLK